MTTDDTTRRIVIPSAHENDTERLAPPTGDDDRTLRITLPAGELSAEPKPDNFNSGATDDIYDQYAVLGKIGGGGMGIVYLAKDRKLGRFVAIKRLKPNAQAIDSLRRRFLHEARAAAALAHPHIVHLYGIGEDREGPFIIMEYVAGDLPPDPAMPDSPSPSQTLEQYTERHGAMMLSAAVELIAKLGRAVSYAHSCGVIHRDLKPSNILMARSGEPKIADFGLARLARAEESKLTMPGEKLLSLGYGAPEQELDASMSDERADVYGLGALLYFCLTAQNPRYFREEDLPIPIRQSVCKAIAPDREQRWNSVDAFIASLVEQITHAKAEQPTIKTTWRCKWCDTVNPLATTFCAECGWDGGTQCLECGSKTHFGMLFCRACGANARDYENVAATLNRTRQSILEYSYEEAIASAAHASNFEPNGINGRRMAETLHELRAEAEKKIARRTQLNEIIEMEMRVENYERAERFIRELRGLSPDPTIFSEQLSTIPDLILKRDLARTRVAMREGDWRKATRLLGAMNRARALREPEFNQLTHMLKRHRQTRSAMRAVGIGAAMVSVYTLSFPVVAKFTETPERKWWSGIFRPAAALYGSGAARGFTARYSQLLNVSEDRLRWQISTEDIQSGAHDKQTTPSQQPSTETIAIMQAVNEYREAYNQQIRELEEEYRRNIESWPPNYRRALKEQRDRLQASGDYNGWRVVSAELERFDNEADISTPSEEDPTELRKLKLNYSALLESYEVSRARKLAASTKRMINDLSAHLKELTREGRMEAAEVVSTEIERLRASERFMRAELLLAKIETTRPEADMTGFVSSATGDSQALSELQKKYEDECRLVRDEYTERIDEWPDKYIEALQKFMEVRQAAGDYVGWQTANYELERFELERVVIPDQTLGDDSDLERLRQRLLNMLKEYELTKARGLVEATERYTKKLDALVSQYTKAKNIAEASVVNTELRRVTTSAELTAAKQLLETEAESEGR